MSRERQNEIEVMIEAVSHEDILNGSTCTFVRLHEGHFVCRHAVAIPFKRALLYSVWPGTNKQNYFVK